MSKTVKNIIMVMGGNVFTLLAGILAGFLLPKFLSVDGYGYYKTFTLYSSYIGLCSFGIIDGIVLRYGNYDFQQLDEELFRAYFRWYLYLHFLIAGIITLFSSIFLYDEIRVIVFFVAIELIASNCIGYFQQISQITRRFNELTVRKIIQSVANLIILSILTYYYYNTKNVVNYRLYVLLVLFITYLMFAWYSLTYRKIVFGKHISLLRVAPEISKLIKLGIPLTVANLTSTLILTIDRQFVSLLFPNQEYAVYAFAYNMLSLVTVTISAISTVMYPTLKRSSKDKLNCIFNNLNSVIIIISFAAISLYFPLCSFVKWFLPQYTDSLVIFRIIFPGVAITTPITTIMHNYYKVYGINELFFKKGLLALLLSIFANIIAYIGFGTMESISIASIIMLVLWYLFIDEYFVVNIPEYSRWKNVGYIVLIMIAFYFSSLFSLWLVGLFVYVVSYICTTLLFHKRTLLTLWKGKL